VSVVILETLQFICKFTQNRRERERERERDRNRQTDRQTDRRHQIRVGRL